MLLSTCGSGGSARACELSYRASASTASQHGRLGQHRAGTEFQGLSGVYLGLMQVLVGFVVLLGSYKKNYCSDFGRVYDQDTVQKPTLGFAQYRRSSGTALSTNALLSSKPRP